MNERMDNDFSYLFTTVSTTFKGQVTKSVSNKNELRPKPRTTKSTTNDNFLVVSQHNVATITYVENGVNVQELTSTDAQIPLRVTSLHLT